jgi:hypothetical protein
MCLALVLLALSGRSLLRVSAQSASSVTFKLPRSSPYACGYFWADFSLNGGEAVVLKWSTISEIPVAVDIYVGAPTGASATWFCDIGPEASLYVSGAFGSTSWVTPTTATYAFVVVNSGQYNVAGTLLLFVVNTTLISPTTGYGYAREPVCPLYVLSC